MKKAYLAGLAAFALFGLGVALGSQFLTKPATADKLKLDEQDATIQAIKKTMPSVVSIVVYNEEPVVEMINGTSQTVQKKINKGQGTGFIISADGLILTNKHVVNAANDKTGEYNVILSNKKEYTAKLIGKDPLHDLAVLKISETKLPYLEMGSSTNSPIGLTVMAIGNVLGRYNNSVTKGIISGLGRTVVASDPMTGGLVSLDNVLQTDAEINEGNSGGPLINLEGKVVGINVAVDKSGTGLGFAIPIDDARSVVDSVRKTGRIIRVRLGVRYQMIDSTFAAEKLLPKTYGAYITKDDAGGEAIVPDSPAAKAGLEAGDIILEINAVKLDGSSSLLSVIQRYKPGDKIGLKIQRGSQTLTKVVVLDEFKAE